MIVSIKKSTLFLYILKVDSIKKGTQNRVPFFFFKKSEIMLLKLYALICGRATNIWYVLLRRTLPAPLLRLG